MLHKTAVALVFSAITMTAGCASVSADQASLEERTAFAIGLDKTDFTISDRQDKGTRTDYVVKTSSGDEYRCYVGSMFSVVGRVVSDAQCAKKGEPMKNPLLR